MCRPAKSPSIDLIVSGDIKGIAGVVGCSNLTAGGHDVLSVELTKELIAKDILVLTAGCSSGGIENCGLMTPEAAKYAGPKLRAVCEKLNIPPEEHPAVSTRISFAISSFVSSTEVLKTVDL